VIVVSWDDSASLNRKRDTDDGTHRRDIESEKTATDNGDGCNDVDVPDGIHGCCTPPSGKRSLCEEETRRRKQLCLTRTGLML
jgi:hypothetical protein